MRSLSQKSGLPCALAVLAMLVAACGGGGGSGGADASDDATDLVLIDVSVGGNAGVALNQIIRLEFSEAIAPGTVSPETVRIRLGPNFAKQVPGELSVIGNMIEFAGRLPTRADLSDSGLIPAATYQVEVPGFPAANTLRNLDGDALRSTQVVTFATAAASSPKLFIDYHPDTAPHVVAVNPKEDATDVPGDASVEITISEPLHPATTNTSNVRLTMIERPAGNVLDPRRSIQGTVVLEQSRGSVVLKFVPLFPLADNAKYELSIDRRVTDLVGNDMVPFTSHFTLRDEPPVPGQFNLDFEAASEAFVDTDQTIASWNRDVPGAVSGIFTAGAGNGSDGDFKPVFNTVLDADAQPGGVFNFRVVEIPAGVTVRVTGNVPATILSLATMRIDGTLDASGGAGADSEISTTASTIPATPGGQGGPGGGDGGAATHNITVTTSSTWDGPDGGSGGDGYGTTDTGAEGGRYGTSTWPTYYYKMGSGGGGGGHFTKGADGEKTRYTAVQYQNDGGPGGKVSGDASLEPVTGGGGGGSGSQGRYYSVPYNNGASAGGGGGGGIALASANDILITGGSILADGGDGGLIANSGTYAGGSGGGGAGGAIFAKSLRSVVLDNAKLSAVGGQAGGGGNPTFTGLGGDGGAGFVRLHDGDGAPTITGSTNVQPAAFGTGTFVATGAGAPSVAQTLWINTGVFDPDFIKPNASDITQVLPKIGQAIAIEIQMAPEDVFDLGTPDESLASAWVSLSDIESLNGNGYSFFKLRITFTLASDQEIDDPLPFVEHLRLRYVY